MNEIVLTAADLRFNPPSFTKSALLEEVKNIYGLSGTLKPLVGERDQNHLLETDEGDKYIVKVAGPDEDRSVVDYQIKTLQHIENKNPSLNIPRNLKTLEGGDYAIIKSSSGQEHMIRLLSYVDGVPFGEDYKPPLNVLFDAGRFQGQMCAALSDFSHPSEGYFMPWDTSQGLILNPALRVSKHGDVERLIVPLLDHFRDHVLPTMNGFRKQTIHNDAHNDNVLRSAPGMDDFYGLIDFGDICYAPVIQDLSVPMIGYVGDVKNPIETGSAYVKGFASAYQLDREALDILYDLLILRAALTVQLIDFRMLQNDVNMQVLEDEYPMLVTRLENLLAIDRKEITNAFHLAHKEGVNKH
ncbi:MAG: phosphotransferase [Kordiimonadaceae bacterium]|jgi:hydroxylysine kinase|nr:phosphotransferase [Kordiimonadaceae bacterium]MBT6328818.1 phosphotransferase [Kordiimonadaceae bacterium]